MGGVEGGTPPDICFSWSLKYAPNHKTVLSYDLLFLAQLVLVKLFCRPLSFNSAKYWQLLT